jgi:hypothetical protein
MVVGWIVLAVVAFLTVIVLFKSQNLMGFLGIIKNNIFYIFLIGVVLFFAFSLNHIHQKYDVDLKSFEGLIQAGQIYFYWFTSIFNNAADVSGYAIKQDWWLDSINATKIR